MKTRITSHRDIKDPGGERISEIDCQLAGYKGDFVVVGWVGTSKASIESVESERGFFALELACGHKLVVGEDLDDFDGEEEVEVVEWEFGFVGYGCCEGDFG